MISVFANFCQRLLLEGLKLGKALFFSTAAKLFDDDVMFHFGLLVYFFYRSCMKYAKSVCKPLYLPPNILAIVLKKTLKAPLLPMMSSINSSYVWRLESR